MPKRYTCCLRCERLFVASRRDARTCSGACRTWLSRHPERREELETIAYRADLNTLGELARAMYELRLRASAAGVRAKLQKLERSL